MALFRRNKSDDTPALPEEVNSYYQAERRDRTWMAWLLALLSLAVAALIIMGLFFGGRWLYRKLRPQSKPAEPTATQTAEESPVATNNSSENSNSNPDNANKDKEKEKSQGTVNAPANPAPSSSSQTPPATTTQPPTGNSNLPTTGPGDVVAVFVLSTVGGTLVHRYVLRSKKEL